MGKLRISIRNAVAALRLRKMVDEEVNNINHHVEEHLLHMSSLSWNTVEKYSILYNFHKLATPLHRINYVKFPLKPQRNS